MSLEERLNGESPRSPVDAEIHRARALLETDEIGRETAIESRRLLANIEGQVLQVRNEVARMLTMIQEVSDESAMQKHCLHGIRGILSYTTLSQESVDAFREFMAGLRPTQQRLIDAGERLEMEFSHEMDGHFKNIMDRMESKYPGLYNTTRLQLST